MVKSREHSIVHLHREADVAKAAEEVNDRARWNEEIEIQFKWISILSL